MNDQPEDPNQTITLYGPCRGCGHVASWMDRREDEAGWTWNCAHCGFQFGVMIDGGTLDLGLTDPQ